MECSVVCAEIGFAMGSCDAGCACDAPVSPRCDLGVSAFCVCLEAETGTPCTSREFIGGYELCHSGDPNGLAMGCFADFVDEAQLLVDCEAAVLTCLPM